MIELNPDLYGRMARLSALADFLEAQAFKHGVSSSRSILADSICDQHLYELEYSPFISGSELVDAYIYTKMGDQQERSREVASMVFDTLHSRATCLGSKYPFIIHKNSYLEYKDETLEEQSIYLYLLSLTLCHAYGKKELIDSTKVLPPLVCRYMKHRGLHSEEIPLGSTQRGAFLKRLEGVASKTGLPFTPTLAPTVPTRAQDAGVDILSCIPFNSSKSGDWVFLGQVTCANSNQWNKKRQEPQQRVFKKLLGDSLEPKIFFSVPHHVSEEIKRSFMEDSDCLTLDRLTLSLGLDHLTPEEFSALKRFKTLEVATD